MHLRHLRPRDVVLNELATLTHARHTIAAQLAALDRRINRLLDDLIAARQREDT
jgi:hypothetical protein